ncbi:hypothetical protein ACFL01_02995 [Planctomycetota bacterium]
MTEKLSIGWASADMTPDKPVQICGQFHERISERVRDPITATALALEANGEQAVMVSCDVVGVHGDLMEGVRERVAAQVGDLDTKKIFLAATHTHTGPLLGRTILYPEPTGDMMTVEESKELFMDRVAEAVVAAWNARAAGGVSGVLGHAAVGFNRRLAYADGTSQMYGDSDREDFVSVEGSQDHGVEILFTWDPEGNPTGAIVNLACPSQVVEGKSFLSADFWCEARIRLKKRFGEGFFVLPLCSAAGDQSPRDLVRRGRGEADMRDEDGLVEMGRRIANAVEDVYEDARSNIRNEVSFEHAVEDLVLPGIEVPEGELAGLRKDIDTYKEKNPEPGSSEWGRMCRYEEVLGRFSDSTKGPDLTMELHVMRLGDVAFCTNPFELFLDYGLRIKARSRAAQTFVIQLACDMVGYLPTAKAVAGAGYGATVSSNPVGPEGGDQLVETTIERINSLWDGR